MSFMRQIDAARRPPLDQLAADYWAIKMAKSEPSIDFCRQALGVPEPDEAVARRLAVPVATVRGWREIGRRASPRSCR
jgi:hypothetical protein